MHYHHYFKLLNRYHHYSTGDRYERACSRFTRQNCKHNSINYVKFKTTFGKYVKMIKQLRALKTNNASIAVNFEAKKFKLYPYYMYVCTLFKSSITLVLRVAFIT